MRRWRSTARALAMCALAVGGAGCTSTRVGDLTVATPKNLGYAFEAVGDTATGEDCVHWFLIFPFGKLNPTLDGAIEAAVDSAPGADALADATLHRTVLFGLIYSRGCVTVSGTPIRTRTERPPDPG